MTISALLLEAMGTLLLFLAIATFVGILTVRVVQSFTDRLDSITQHRVVQVYFWTIVVAAIAVGLKALSAVLLLNVWEIILHTALTYGLIRWARIEWRKMAVVPFDKTLQRYYDLVRTGQIDVEEEWNKESSMSSENPNSPYGT